MQRVEKTGTLVLVRRRACLLVREFAQPDNLVGAEAMVDYRQNGTLTSSV